MCVRTIAICDSDINKLEEALMRDFSVGDKLELVVIKKGNNIEVDLNC